MQPRERAALLVHIILALAWLAAADEINHRLEIWLWIPLLPYNPKLFVLLCLNSISITYDFSDI